MTTMPTRASSSSVGVPASYHSIGVAAKEKVEESRLLTVSSAPAATQDANNNSNDNDDNNNDLSLADRRSFRRQQRAVLFLCAMGASFLALASFSSSSKSTTPQQEETPLLQRSKSKKTNDFAFPNPHNLRMPNGVNLGSWLSLEDYFFAGTGASVEVATPFGRRQGNCLPPLWLGDRGTHDKHILQWGSETDLLKQLWQGNNKDNAKTIEKDATTNNTSSSSSSTSKRPGNAATLAKALQTIHAHRVSFVDLANDLALLRDLNIQNLRVPVSWCWTDAEPQYDDSMWTEQELLDRFVCVDPYLQDTYWPAVPTSLLTRFLRACAEHNLTVVLDVHTYPGATSIGTFSGIWPQWPVFWQHDLTDKDLGRSTFANVLTWLEALHDMDPLAFSAVRGVSPMNEPAHLTGLYDGPDPVISDNPEQPPFVPELPRDVADTYLTLLHASSNTTTTPLEWYDNDNNILLFSHPLLPVPDGAHLRVLLWLRDAVQAFRSTNLPKWGLQLHVNIIESIFAPSLLLSLAEQEEQDQNDNIPPSSLSNNEKAMMARTQWIAQWWKEATSRDERSTWAVLDYHRYHAWDSECQGTVEGVYGNYTCSDTTARTQTLTRCARWAGMYRSIVDQVCGMVGDKGDQDNQRRNRKSSHHHKSEEPAATRRRALLASAEFSVSTHHSVRHACQDVDTLVASYNAQVEAAWKADIDLYYWSFRMPNGGTFRNAWSFQHLLHRAGVLPHQPDEPLWPSCGDHVRTPLEPEDLSF